MYHSISVCTGFTSCICPAFYAAILLINIFYFYFIYLNTCQSLLLVGCLFFPGELVEGSLGAARHCRRKLLILQLLLDPTELTLCRRHYTASTLH